MNKYWLITYGCQMNKSDGERIAQVLEGIGYKKTSKIHEAELIVVNMCSVRQSAVDRVYGLRPKFKSLRTKNYKLTLRQAQGDGERSRTIKTVLTGCVLKKDRRKFAKFFDYILNIKDLPNWEKYFVSIWRDRSDLKLKNYFKIPSKYSSFPVAYMPISTGCDNFCSYCVVPYTRGQEICRPAKEIVDEVKELIKQGFKEIWLLGQNVNDYRSGLTQISTQNNADINFAELLKMVNGIPGKFWIRFTSSHPKDFSDELIEVMADCERITPYLNLPVQSGDDEILRRMNRNYKIEDYKNLVKKIRKKIPEITLSTDVIVGFPEETKKQFENTARLFKEIKYDMAYIAQYSPRPGTAAAKLKDNVSREEKKERERTLTDILKKTALAKNEKCLGKTVEVLPMEYKNGFLISRSFHYKNIKFEGPKGLIGKFTKVKITAAQPWGLSGYLR